MEGLTVEVCCENGAYYKAFVSDVFNDGVSVAFENDWRPESTFPFSQVYLPRPDSTSSTEYTENQEVEVFTKLKENEASGWWKAVMKMTTGKFHLVKYGQRNIYMKIVGSNQVRPKSDNPPIDHNTFYKFEIEVPEELREQAKMEDIHEEFRKSIIAEICRYSPDLGVLIVISRNKQSRQLSEMLQKMHFHNLNYEKIMDNQLKSASTLQLRNDEITKEKEKQLQEKNKLLQEKKSIISCIECPVCLEYMTAHIYQCSVGHSVCSKCKHKLVKCPSCKNSFTSTRNYSLEKIIENISFPCSNAKFGCEDMILLNEKDKHCKRCDYRLYECLPGREEECKWKGRRQDILSHIEKEHSELILKGEINNIIDTLCFDTDELVCSLISAHGEIFWLQRCMDADESTYYISVHYIGPEENCKKYIYTLNLVSSSDPQQKLIYSMQTHPDHVEIDDIKGKVCFSIKECTAEYFDMAEEFSYDVEITKRI